MEYRRCPRRTCDDIGGTKQAAAATVVESVGNIASFVVWDRYRPGIPGGSRESELAVIWSNRKSLAVVVGAPTGEIESIAGSG